MIAFFLRCSLLPFTKNINNVLDLVFVFVYLHPKYNCT